ncbi:NADP-dependent oxidoreductase domain-containing protein [Suillus spraguei]|nr:NADP-dependent oxidoreductase domain-containing protein [Suillus spraguei]
MNQVHQLTSKLRLLDFPVEIVIDILGRLNVYDLVRARRVSNYIRQIIDSSSELLYSIDLEYFNAIPVLQPLARTSQHFISRFYKANQRGREPSTLKDTPSTFLESQQQIVFLQPQLEDRHSNTMSLREWNCKLDSPSVISHYNFSVAEDLVILLVRAPSRSLSENKVHPEVAFSSVKALDDEVDSESFNPFTPISSIFGDYYGVLFRKVNKVNGGIADFLQIWNWKSKDTFQCLEVFDPTCKTMNFSFLTNDKILVVNAKELPIPSHACTHNQLIALSMDISGESLAENPCFTSYVERNTLLELESTYTSHYGQANENSPNLPWSSWGPTHTRSFEESSFDPCKHSVFGFRSASLVGDQNSERPLCIRDFNPHRVVNFKAGNETRRNQRLIEGGEILPSSSLFVEPLGSGLPYIETTIEEKFLSTDMTMEANRVTFLIFEIMTTISMSQAGEQGIIKREVLQGFEVLDFEAYAYGNEKEVGESLRASGVPREEVFITSKLWDTYHKRVEDCLDQTLADLETTYLDLYLVHWPIAMNPNGNHPVMPMRPNGNRDVDESWDIIYTWKSMEAMVKRGKVKAIGASNFSQTVLERILPTAEIIPAANQLEIHLYNPQLKLLEYLNILATWFDQLTDETATEIAKKYGLKSTSDVLFAKDIIVLPKSATPSRIESNLTGALEAYSLLTPEDIKILDGVVASGKRKRSIMPLWGIDLGFDNWPAPTK